MCGVPDQRPDFKAGIGLASEVSCHQNIDNALACTQSKDLISLSVTLHPLVAPSVPGNVAIATMISIMPLFTTLT